MKAAKLYLDWKPKKDHKLSHRDVPKKRAQAGNMVWRNPHIKIVDVAKPEIGPTEVLIKVKACGICGSDVLMAKTREDGYTAYGYIMANEVTIGHEFSGEIVEIGKAIKDFQRRLEKPIFKSSTPVTAQCVIFCGLCEKCKEGKFDECLINEERGFSVDGGMAEYVISDVRHIFSLEELKDRYAREKLFLAGALIEPLAGAYKAIYESGKGIEIGDYAVVIGGGPIGLSGVMLLKAMGAAKVILSEPSLKRRKLGKAVGADFTFDPGEADFKDVIMDITKGQGAKLYFEAAGVYKKVYPQIDELFKRGDTKGKLILMGHGDDVIEISTETLMGGYNMLAGSHGHSGIWRRMIRLVSSGLIDPIKIITRKISIDEVPAWLKELQTNKEEGKVIIQPGRKS